MLIQRMRRENGSRGRPRREMPARNGVCGFCYEALRTATRIDCRCKRFSYCSRICKNTHWHRRHQFRCHAIRSQYPEPVYEEEWLNNKRIIYCYTGIIFVFWVVVFVFLWLARASSHIATVSGLFFHFLLKNWWGLGATCLCCSPHLESGPKNCFLLPSHLNVIA